MAGDVAAVVLLLGAFACVLAAARGRGAGTAAAAFAAALAVAAAALAELAPASARAGAAALAAVGLALVVLRRFGGVPGLSWLDAAIGLGSTAALVTALEGDAAAAAGLGGAVGGLALSRWLPGAEGVLAAAGVAALGVSEATAPLAAPLLGAAAWRRVERVEIGPPFRWTVLAAIVGCAALSLTLLALGQEIAFPLWTPALAFGAVLAGIARAGITVTQRLRDSERQATTDDLTGLANRRRLLQHLDAAVVERRSVALLLVDLDGFKELNDTLGHHAGDQVLLQVGPRLTAALPEHEALARLGGDEFAVVLAPGDEALASAAGLRLRRALEPSFDVEGIAVHVTASVGIALFPEHTSSAAGLLQRADVAMYEAKRVRSGHEVYLPERDRHSRDRLALIGELHDAIDAGRLSLHHQPKVSVASERVTGVEALVRWDHHQHGMLSPASFLPLIEHSGLTRALTAFVLDRALAEIGPVTHHGEPLTVAVNLGPADLLDYSLPPDVARALDRHAFPAERLTLEVSEEMVMADPERTLGVLADLRKLGLQVALDDFGAGRSSLTHLKQLRVDELKIDRSFLLAPLGEEDAAIVASTITLAHRLGLRVVAEGVATPEAWDLLVTCACDEGQGFLMARPMPVARLLDWLATREREQAARPG